MLLGKRTRERKDTCTQLVQAVQGLVSKSKHETALWWRLWTTFMVWPQSEEITETAEQPRSKRKPVYAPRARSWTHVVCFTRTHSFCRHIHWNVSARELTALGVWPWQQTSGGPCLVLDPPSGQITAWRGNLTAGNCGFKRVFYRKNQKLDFSF